MALPKVVSAVATTLTKLGAPRHRRDHAQGTFPNWLT
jgi:hypothetical protein